MNQNTLVNEFNLEKLVIRRNYADDGFLWIYKLV